MANNQGASGYDYRAIGEEDELENTAMEAAPASPSRESRLKWRPTNTMLLMVAGVSFGVFAVAEMVAAFESNSLSLLGDASTMIVDSSKLLCEYGVSRLTSFLFACVPTQ